VDVYVYSTLYHFFVQSASSGRMFHLFLNFVKQACMVLSGTMGMLDEEVD